MTTTHKETGSTVAAVALMAKDREGLSVGVNFPWHVLYRLPDCHCNLKSMHAQIIFFRYFGIGTEVEVLPFLAWRVQEGIGFIYPLMERGTVLYNVSCHKDRIYFAAEGNGKIP